MIRRATSADIAGMIPLLARHHADHPASFPFPFDAALASTDLAAMIGDPAWLCLIGPSSLFIGLAYRPPLLPVRLAIEVFLRCERPRVRPLMTSEFERWARAQGCERTALATTHSFPAFCRLYARDGYQPAEMTLTKAL